MLRRILLCGAATMLACVASSCSDTMNSMMMMMCSVEDDPPSSDTGANANSCTPKKGAGDPCRHRGGSWKHNWFADYYRNEFFPDSGPHSGGTKEDWGYGCDADLSGVSFDGIKMAQNTLFEVKTANYSDAIARCVGFMAEIFWNEVLDSAKKEEPAATTCNYTYELVICDQMLFDKAAAYFVNHKNVHTIHDSACEIAPPKPDGYTGGSLTVVPVSPIVNNRKFDPVGKETSTMSYRLFAIPLARPVTDVKELDEPGVIRTVTLEQARAEVSPVLPTWFRWDAGETFMKSQSPDGTEDLDITYCDDGRCLFIGGSFGWSGTQAEAAIRRLARLPGWLVVDSQMEFVR